jgi:polyphenol oxidase
MTGTSQQPFASFNLGAHVGDDPAAVLHNRQQLAEWIGTDAPIEFLTQVHGVAVRDLDATQPSDVSADACFTRTPGRVCAILTADCLPILFAAHDGTIVGAAHAGWRGLLQGLLPATLAAMGVAPQLTAAYLGPCIGPRHFEVGADVRDAYVAHNAQSADYFRAVSGMKWLADLPGLARLQFNQLGLTNVTDSGLCTVEHQAQFYSYRREQGHTGRFASLIWLQPAQRRLP